MLGPLLALCALIDITFAQLTPSVVYQPPDPNDGAQVTNGTRPNRQYSNLLGNALWFYEAQRSGKLPESNRVEWRNDSVLEDGSDWGIDLSRSYFDAGDYSINSFNLAGVSLILSCCSEIVGV
jgi:endoglucanase